MAKKQDLSNVSPGYAARVLAARESKRREYLRKKEILLARTKAWRVANMDKEREIGRAWREANPEHKAQITRASYERNREEVIARQAERDRMLCDATVRARFARGSGLQSQDVPDEIIPLVRASLLINRELKQKRVSK